MSDSLVPWLVICGATTLAMAMDIRRFRISNVLTIGLLISGLAYQIMFRGWGGLGQGLAGAAFGFAVLIIPYAVGGMGAGDVKFFAGVGAWLGFAASASLLVAAGTATAIYAFSLAAVRGGAGETLLRVKEMALTGVVPADRTVEVVATQPDRHLKLVPFAAMVAAGIVLLAAWSVGTGEAPFGMNPPWRIH